MILTCFAATSGLLNNQMKLKWLKMFAFKIFSYVILAFAVNMDILN